MPRAASPGSGRRSRSGPANPGQDPAGLHFETVSESFPSIHPDAERNDPSESQRENKRQRKRRIRPGDTRNASPEVGGSTRFSPGGESSANADMQVAPVQNTPAQNGPAEAAAGQNALLPASSTVRDVDLARQVRETALAVEGVVAIGNGLRSAARTFGLPGETVYGVRVSRSNDRVEIAVHVTVKLCPLPQLADRVRTAVARFVGLGAGDTVDVWIDDVVIDP